MEIVYLNLSIPVLVITTQADELSLLNRPMHFIVCIGAGSLEKFHNRIEFYAYTECSIRVVR